MASFVTRVLVAAGDLEKANLQEKISDIKKEITTLMDAVKDFMNDNYINFTPGLNEDQMLVLKAEKLIEEMISLQNRVNEQIKLDLSGSIEELNNLSKELKETNLSLRLSKQLLLLNEYINCVKEHRKRENYVEIAKTLKLMQTLLDSPENELPKMNIYTAIQEEYIILFSSFLTEASYFWGEQICWSIDDDDKTVTNVCLSIGDQFDKIENLMRALHCIDHLFSNMQKFSAPLMKYIISPIIQDNCTIQIVEQISFKVQITKRKKIPNYDSVLHNLTLLFKFLHQHFNIIIHDDQTFLMKLQTILLNPLAETLIADCMSHTIPKTSAELVKFDTIREQCCAFQNYLIEIGFITNDQLFLSEYTKDIEKLFTDKICQDFLVEAREIMRKDLHNSVMYNPKVQSNHTDDDHNEWKGKLSENTFQFPKCQISKSVQEILELAKNILNEACRSSQARTNRLYDTCRSVFDMYAVLVVECHRTLIETIPREAALFHNNCMYLAHHLLTLTYEYKYIIRNTAQKMNLTFVDQTLLLRTVGVEHLLAHMRYQRNIVADILKESGLSTLGQSSKLHPGTERALRQCIRQLELLKAAWLDILPITNYCKAIGCIADSIVEELITRVMSVEDIPADVATELSTTFEIVANRVPLIFPDPSMIQQYVKRWKQFIKLISVLVASLKEIAIDWENGKGPLSEVFSASQVKQLIRALFQNTERRSALLATIK